MALNKIMNNISKDLIVATLATPLGPVLALVDTTHLYMLKFTDQNTLQKSIEHIKATTHANITEGSNKLSVRLQDELDCYFNGTLQQFSTPVQLYGTSFQQNSWNALTKIPYGHTTSYSQQATAVGNSKAFRAVANANGKNPIAIIIPCHRIIKLNGDLCGYNGGVHRKQALLDLEKMYLGK